jgi:hypothetical protein
LTVQRRRPWPPALGDWPKLRELPAGFSRLCCSSRFERPYRGDTGMTLSVAHLQPLVALIAGVLILLVPRILNYVVAIYLIIVGLLGLGFLR